MASNFKYKPTAEPFNVAQTASNIVSANDQIELNIQSSNPFHVTPLQLQRLVDPKNKTYLDELGGIEGLSKALRVDLTLGLSSDETFENPLGRRQSWASFDSAALKNSIQAVWRRSMASFNGTHASIIVDQSFKKRSEVFGRNVLPVEPQKSVLELMWMAYHDRTLILLTVVAILSLLIGIYREGKDKKTGSHEWIEGLAIIIAVFIVLSVQSVNDYQKEKQFRNLNAKKEDRAVKGLRNGKQTVFSTYHVQVGDILMLEPGDWVTADGILIESHNLQCDESSITGESDLIKKQSYFVGLDCEDPFVLSGSKINEGIGKFLVIAVGERSLYGKAMMGLRQETEDTPLQRKLDALAENIAKAGLAMAILLVVALTLKFCIVSARNGWPPGSDVADKITDIFIEAIIIVVVAVPEGLPLAVTLALAYATRRMLKDNNLVRILSACETMGGATTICSDKTGTLTQNEMTVVIGTIGLDLKFNNKQDILKIKNSLHEEKSSNSFPVGCVTPRELHAILTESIALNTTVFESKNEKGEIKFFGSKTETALLNWAILFGLADYREIRNDSAMKTVHIFPFSSERKVMSVVIRKAVDTRLIYRIFIKGASEIVLAGSKRYVSLHKGKTPFFELADIDESVKSKFGSIIRNYAEQSLRTIGLAYRDLVAEEFCALLNLSPNEKLQKNLSEQQIAILGNFIQTEMDFLGVFGIEDPIRDGVADAVKKCQHAGVFVRMVTGDNPITARAIATKCGILMKGGILMEGPRFRRLTDPEFKRIIPRLQVLARSSPMDKQILVQRLKAMGETVAVTGDGTNDGPALKIADVGFSMGIAGTEVAKEASSIVLMDDNFSSIVKALLWGRAVNDAVKKFLQFQLTVNISAVTLAFLTALASNENESVLGPVQLLWINLIMDSFAALALATDAPTDDLLDRPPDSKRSPLITVPMIKMILGQALFQIILGLACVQLVPAFYPKYGFARDTFVFNVFVFMQLFNEVNCRSLGGKLNVFHNISKNYFFIGIMVITIFTQVIIVNFGGYAFSTVPLPAELWVLSILLPCLTLPLGVLIRLIPDWDGCSIMGHDIGVPDRSRIQMTKEKLRWMHAIDTVQTQLSVFRALRGKGRLYRKPSKAFTVSSYGSFDETIDKDPLMANAKKAK